MPIRVPALFPALALGLALTSLGSTPAPAATLCQGFGPQTPRDIALHDGANPEAFSIAPPASKMNLCNIHFHTQAEHKGPGFSLSAGAEEHGGYRCNDTPKLAEPELRDPSDGHGGCGHLHPGDSVEVHWVYTTCDVKPGPTLGSCLSENCQNPQLRVETQVFLAVNDVSAQKFDAFIYGGTMMNGLHQPKALPTGTGDPVVFRGSTTGPKYTQETCSPFQVTWSVRPYCAKISIASLHHWCQGNVFKEDHAHGVRQLVTAPELLAPIH